MYLFPFNGTGLFPFLARSTHSMFHFSLKIKGPVPTPMTQMSPHLILITIYVWSIDESHRIRATRGRNQIVFTHKLKFIKTSAQALARVLTHRTIHARAHAPHYRLDSTTLNFRDYPPKNENNKMCQINVTDGRTDATIIPAWTQLIVTLCYNNLVSNKWLITHICGGQKQLIIGAKRRPPNTHARSAL
jgi:hypothetical protein